MIPSASPLCNLQCPLHLAKKWGQVRDCEGVGSLMGQDVVYTPLPTSHWAKPSRMAAPNLQEKLGNVG